MNVNLNCLADSQFKIIASINNIPITKFDLKKELIVFQILNKNKIVRNEEDIILNNLIEEKIKIIEINKEKMEIDTSIVNSLYYTLIKNLNIEKTNIDKNIVKIIKEKIKTDRLWNELVAKKYAWKINVNIEEINNKIVQNNKKNLDIENIKEKLIIEEKNKKLIVYSKFYLNQLKNKSLIKYYK